MGQLMRGMASSSCHVRRPRPAVPVAWDEASSSRRRKRPRYRPPPSPVTASSPSYSPTSPSYAPTSPAYSPTEPLNWAPEEPRHVEDVIGEEPGSEGQDDEEEEQSGSERDGSDGYDGEEGDQQAREEEEEETPRRRRVRDEEGESDGEQEQDYSDGSDGENGVEDDEQQASHLLSEEEEEPQQPHGEERRRRRRSASGREQEHPDGSDGGNNGVEGEHQTGGEEEEEAPPLQAHGEDAAVAADGDLSAVATARPSSPALSIRSESSSAVLGEMTVDRTAGLDCGICFLPLKPPIFQCDVGHVVCSPCRDKLAVKGRCHVCRDPTGFRRCHAMEQVVDAVRVPCPHAAHGCADRPAYHDRDRHATECPHAPYRCPAGADACGFFGPAPALAEHAAAAHGWACATAEASRVAVDLRDGFNFLLTAARGGAGGGAQHLLLLNVARTPYGRAVSAAWLRPRRQTAAAATAARSARCELGLYYSHYKDDLVRKHTQGSRFHVASMDDDPAAWDALKDPGASFQFLVPNRLGGSDVGDLRVTVDINIVTS